jgi:hypothetical protein
MRPGLALFVHRRRCGKSKKVGASTRCTPKSFHAALARRAEREGVSLNMLVTTLLAEELGRRSGAQALGDEEDLELAPCAALLHFALGLAISSAATLSRPVSMPFQLVTGLSE